MHYCCKIFILFMNFMFVLVVPKLNGTCIVSGVSHCVPLIVKNSLETI